MNQYRYRVGRESYNNILSVRTLNETNNDILNNIWGENYFGTDRVVDDLIRRLRKKMPLLDINTIYGYGYRLLWKNLLLLNNSCLYVYLLLLLL